jgi:hypothetical protein
MLAMPELWLEGAGQRSLRDYSISLKEDELKLDTQLCVFDTEKWGDSWFFDGQGTNFFMTELF